MNKNLERLRTKIKNAEEKFRDAVAAAQKVCQHVHLAEADYKPSNGIGYAFPPIRMCLDCGMTEEGWGSGYIALKGNPIPIDRKELYIKRAGLILENDDKGPLIRGEVSLADLIEQRIKP